MASAGNGLAAPAGAVMAFWTAIEPGYLLRFQQWHNCEHIPERLAIPGFLTGRRYRAADDSARFLILYEADDPAVFTSAPYLAALNSPTQWTREALANFRDAVRNVYRPLADAGSAVTPASFVIAARLDLAGTEPIEAREAALAARLAAAPDGRSRTRLLVLDAAGSSVETAERRIYGGGPGKQSHLVLAECPTPSASEAARATLAAALATHGRSVEMESWWLEFAIEQRRREDRA